MSDDLKIPVFGDENSYHMFFWKEAVPESVDKVMITHDTGILNIETQRMRLEIHQFKEGRANDLFNCIRDLRPEPRGSFTDHAGRLGKIRNPNAAPGYKPVPESVAGNSQSGAMYYDDKTRIDNTRLTTFQDDLRNAVRQFENHDEIGLPWVIAEDEIKRMLEDGSVSETDLLSGGLDPNNLDHFMKCVEEIENQLKQQDYEKALSRLQATKKIFMECNLDEMKSLLSLDDITLLKQMYFHSFA
ncbi:uncharacterized protein LOC117335103 [Pecten maximus]|uniref:uncharacterized protein LOC117335103 n=1 Tax=Pecten maximus TaxID=6579 RepID=UPI0014590E10|nr:uncharacterized protein LOC117335103 [Pecten maximus]